MFTSLTSSTSRCERCIHYIVSTSFKSMHYRVYIVHIAIYEMNRNFGWFCLFLVGRDVLSLGVPQSENTYHLLCITTKTRITHQILLWPASFVCVFLWRYNMRISFRVHFLLGRQRHGHLLWLKSISCRISADLTKQLYTFDFAMSTM